MVEVIGLLLVIGLACFLMSRSPKGKRDEKYDYTWFEAKKKPSIKVYTEKKHRISQFNGGWRNYR